MFEFELHNILRQQPLEEGGRVRILRQLDCRFRGGRLCAIIGPSGGGKSTLMRLLNRLDEPDAGEVVRRGQPLQSYPVRQLRRQVAFVPQQTTVFDGSLKENLMLPLRIHQPKAEDVDQDILKELLKRVGLPSRLLNRPATALSGGEKQRLALIRVLLTAPEVLLLDEPDTGLDPPARERLAEVLRQQVEEGQTVILSSHDISFVRRVADDFMFLDQGQIAVSGEIANLDLAPDPALRSFIEAESGS